VITGSCRSLAKVYYVLSLLQSCEISSSHGGEYEVQNCLLGCTASIIRDEYVSLKRRTTIILHGSTSQKTILNIILEIFVYFIPVHNLFWG
jgi:hypothetical protein